MPPVNIAGWFITVGSISMDLGGALISIVASLSDSDMSVTIGIELKIACNNSSFLLESR